MKIRQNVVFVLVIIFSCLIMLREAQFLDNAIKWLDDNIFNCQLQHCCNDFQFKSSAMAIELKKKVHGQHLVVDNVVSILGGHFFNQYPSHALVLSFHGWTGCGKNFVSQIIANNVFRRGLSSPHVKIFMCTHDFLHESKIEDYKDILASTIRSQVERCSRSMFIFDEVDKMPIGLIDTIRPYLEPYPAVNGVDYRKSTFIFLSNTGGEGINNITLNHYKKEGVREKLSLHVMEKAIILGAFNEGQGGLWHTSLIRLNMISAYLPFLPLTKQHVELCIRDELERLKLVAEETLIQTIRDDLQYWPDDYQLFSQSGCKRITQKVEAMYFFRKIQKNEL